MSHDILTRLRAYRSPQWGSALKDVHDAANEIERLRQWIREESMRTDTCTRHILGKVCDNCRCGKTKL